MRTAIRTRVMGTRTSRAPTAPVTIAVTRDEMGPLVPHHTAAATTTARATRMSPSPSRLCAGSRSRAPRPSPRAARPTIRASTVQIRAHTLARPPMARETGPGRSGAAGRAGALARDLAGALAEVLPEALLGSLAAPRADVPEERLPEAVLRVPDALEEDERGAEPAAGEVARDRARVGAGVRVAMNATVDPLHTGITEFTPVTPGVSREGPRQPTLRREWVRLRPRRLPERSSACGGAHR